MDSNAIIALVGAVVIAFIVRVFNVVVEWLARILGVDPPDPIPQSMNEVAKHEVTPAKGVPPVEPPPPTV